MVNLLLAKQNAVHPISVRKLVIALCGRGIIYYLSRSLFPAGLETELRVSSQNKVVLIPAVILQSNFKRY